jgi:DNA-binding winged helix-turn-helix (wHTH) protein/tetratricopeptide (TPR) repeat protein
VDELLHFAPYCLDLANELLWRCADVVPVRPRAFAVLRYLAAHPGRLIPQAELTNAVWHHHYLSDGLLRGYIRELRHALGDDPRRPRFIETAAGRGYRFLAAVTSVAGSTLPTPKADPGRARGAGTKMAYFVGRQNELGWLHERFDRALDGKRQMLWLSGEPGIGKTAIAQLFVSQCSSRHPVWVARGQCVEQHGRGAPYQPVLEALGRLARDGGEPVVAALRRHAPGWLAQLPALVEADERSRLMALVSGSTQDRLARELSEALEALAAHRLLVLWLEDLHWSDPSTVEWLDMLARRIEPVRLLVVGTYRPAEASAPGHPLRSLMQELRAHDLCADLALPPLTRDEVADYVAMRFAVEAGSSAANAWARLLHRRTDGVPLFLAAVADELVAQQVPGMGGTDVPGFETTGEAGIPASLLHLFERQIERLDNEEQQLLGAASVSGMEFSAALLAAVEGIELARVAACCEGLVAANLFLCGTPAWRGPERRAADRYRFRHALHRDMLHRRLPASGVRRLNRRIGECKESSYGERRVVVAAELTAHFEHGGDTARALHHLTQAAQQALQRAANREAIDHLQRALQLLTTLPSSRERDRQELGLQAMLAMPLLMTQGHGAPAVRHAFERAFELAHTAGSTPQLIPSLFSLYRHALLGGDFARAQALAGQMLKAADLEPESPHRPTACLAAGAVLYHRGEFEAALEQVQACLWAHDAERGRLRFLEQGEDEVSIALAYAAWLHIVLGHPRSAHTCAANLRARAHGMDRPFARMEAHRLLAYMGFLSRDASTALAEAEAGLALGREHGLSPLRMASLTLHRGWALALQCRAEEALPAMRAALASVQAAGARLWFAFSWLELGEACLRAGHIDEALHFVEEASRQALDHGHGGWLCESRRLAGEVLLERARSAGGVGSAQAEAAFVEAIALARERRAKLLELRARVSLMRMPWRDRRATEEERLLAELYRSFGEDSDLHDLLQAKQLLDGSNR